MTAPLYHPNPILRESIENPQIGTYRVHIWMTSRRTVGPGTKVGYFEHSYFVTLYLETIILRPQPPYPTRRDSYVLGSRDTWSDRISPRTGVPYDLGYRLIFVGISGKHPSWSFDFVRRRRRLSRSLRPSDGKHFFPFPSSSGSAQRGSSHETPKYTTSRTVSESRLLRGIHSGITERTVNFRPGYPVQNYRRGMKSKRNRRKETKKLEGEAHLRWRRTCGRNLWR